MKTGGNCIPSKPDLKLSMSGACATNKTNNTLGFIKRNIHGCTQKGKQHTFTTMVRPTLEYASTYWDPHSKDLIEDIRKPSVLLALLVMLLMCAFQVRSLLMVTPRYLLSSTTSNM
jgi:hypothetical protein